MKMYAFLRKLCENQEDMAVYLVIQMIVPRAVLIHTVE